MDDVSAVGKAVYGDLLNVCVWNKSNAGMGSLYRSKHELILVFRVGDAPHFNAVQLGKHGRNRTNVWDYASVNSFKGSRREDLALHPTVKPSALVAAERGHCQLRLLPHDDLQMAEHGEGSRARSCCFAFAQRDGASSQADSSARTAGLSLDQRQGSASIWF
jgi:hypothetical protein